MQISRICCLSIAALLSDHSQTFWTPGAQATIGWYAYGAGMLMLYGAGLSLKLVEHVSDHGNLVARWHRSINSVQDCYRRGKKQESRALCYKKEKELPSILKPKQGKLPAVWNEVQD